MIVKKTLKRAKNKRNDSEPENKLPKSTEKMTVTWYAHALNIIKQLLEKRRKIIE